MAVGGTQTETPSFSSSIKKKNMAQLWNIEAKMYGLRFFLISIFHPRKMRYSNHCLKYIHVRVVLFKLVKLMHASLPNAPCSWHMYQKWVMILANVGKYSSTMLRIYSLPPDCGELWQLPLRQFCTHGCCEWVHAVWWTWHRPPRVLLPRWTLKPWQPRDASRSKATQPSSVRVSWTWTYLNKDLTPKG